MLQKMFKMMRKNKKGFTLVELMVVVVIIGVLVAIAVPVYNSVTNNAEKAAIDASIRTLDGAWMIYEASGAPTSDWPDKFIVVDSFTDTTSVVINGKTYTRTGNKWSN